MIMSRDQNIVRNGNVKIGDLSFEGVEKFKYLGATVTNINDTREEIKRRINMGNACYYSVEKLLSSSLLSKNLKVIIYKTVILPVVLYGCETWTLTLREEHRLRVFENKVLRKIFGAKRDEVTREWRKLHNAELHALYSSPDIIRNIKSRRLRWAGHVARMGESRNAHRVLVGRPEGKRPLGRWRRRWEDNIKMDLREVGYDDRDWINLAQDRDRWLAYVRAAMNLRIDGVIKEPIGWSPDLRKSSKSQLAITVKAELLDALRRRRGRGDCTSEDDEDLGLPHSPCNSPTTADVLLEKGLKTGALPATHAYVSRRRLERDALYVTNNRVGSGKQRSGGKVAILFSNQIIICERNVLTIASSIGTNELKMDPVNIVIKILDKLKEEGYKETDCEMSQKELEVVDDIYDLLKSYESEAVEESHTLDIDENEPRNDDNDMPHVREWETEKTNTTSEEESSTSQSSGSQYAPSPPKTSRVIDFQEKCIDQKYFNASPTWLHRFKTHYKIVSRKITSYVTKRQVRDKTALEQSIQTFRRECAPLMDMYDDDHVFNADECGFHKEMPFGRTLERQGTSKCMVSCNPKGQLHIPTL
ncbi:hypothetical protein ANN_13191 [Periplaneta americana]|uniref:Uncharacterized protein n=1 Tax=Periplaneta americana TaxID=6978 RepID=A0ABQ8TL01_PERAM|nr:hypothetical protein ANN_13191 [Periplaneta americana]